MTKYPKEVEKPRSYEESEKIIIENSAKLYKLLYGHISEVIRTK